MPERPSYPDILHDMRMTLPNKTFIFFGAKV